MWFKKKQKEQKRIIPPNMLLVVKVGSYKQPPIDEDIARAKKELLDAINGDGVFVLHHNLDVEVVYLQ